LLKFTALQTLKISFVFFGIGRKSMEVNYLIMFWCEIFMASQSGWRGQIL